MASTKRYIEEMPPNASLESPAQPRSLGTGAYQPALDGIRGLAILLVILFHAGLLGNFRPVTRAGRYVNMLVTSGWIGVDLFFVLSGFLITGILLRSRRQPGYFRNFYARRALRLFPLYYAAILVLAAVLPLVPAAPAVSAKAVSIAATYTVNLAIAFHGWTALPAQMQHFWTLAIEEQFYLAWPLLVYFLSRKGLALVCCAIVALAPALRWFYQSQEAWLPAFVFTLCRIDTLALGGLAAILLQRANPTGSSKWSSKWLLAGVASLAAAGLLAEFGRGRGLHFDRWSMSIFGLSLMAWLGAALVMGVSLWPRSKLARWCSAAPLRSLGKYSYGLYVCQQPVLLALRTVHFDVNLLRRFLPHEVLAYLVFAACATLCSLAAALGSWRLIEAPCLRLKRLFEYGPGI